MPAPIVGGLIAALADNCDLLPWDGEVPRTAPDGTAIVPGASDTTTIWPAVQVLMGPFDRDNNMTSSYKDIGRVNVVVNGATREETEAALDRIEVFLVSPSNWDKVVMKDSLSNDRYRVFDMEVDSWECVQVEDQRLKESSLSYRGTLGLFIQIHGEV